jgi:hypothetical protein
MSDNREDDEFLADDLYTDFEAVLGVRFLGDGTAAVQLVPFGANEDDPADVVVVSAATGHKLLTGLMAYRQRQASSAVAVEA